ncbi:MAG TPA: 23S rRNA (adenine(2503)-C(2))-methyltransferase RlmN [Armatimonadota bacterium]|nr:23S rRNA (adenine(2503)-C(2))-methyltransferase RlmN [Armatimonadota bacterium]
MTIAKLPVATGKSDIKGYLPDELVEALAPLGIPAYRGKQIFSWLHRRLVHDFSVMTDLPADLRTVLTNAFNITVLSKRHEDIAEDGTTKYLFALADGQCIETVYIPEATRGTVCVSTMVGCPFGCTFCATGQSGFTRNLTAAEIVDQVYRVQAALPEGRHVTNLVFMGMGEPLANYTNVLYAIRLLIHPQGLNLAQRRITVSTVGITPAMERLADEGLQVNLALSLHAPSQEGRLKLLPIAKKYPLDGVMTAARQYVRRTGRKVTFEYTVVPGSNDTDEDARKLTELVRHLQCLVNVIPLNPTEGLPRGMRLSATELRARAEHFVVTLRRHGVEASLRRSRGGEVAGACGQLRRRMENGVQASRRPR